MSDAVPPNFLLEPTPYAEAVKWIADKPVVSRKVFDAMVPELRARAFLITGIEDANAAGEIRDIIAKLPAGQSWEKTKAELVGKLGPWLSSDDDENKAANARAELLLRTHGFQAYQVAQHKVMREQEDVFLYWQYLSLDDEKVRPGHAGLNLKVAPAKSAFWNDHSPPWQWGCRCRKVPLLPGDVIEMMTEDAKLPPEQQRVLSPAGLKLAEQGRMYNKAGQQLDIKSDRQKGKLEGFIFDPEALTLPLSSLKGRYDAVTWGEFEKAMKAEKLDDGRTVWGWLDGEVVKASGPAVEGGESEPVPPVKKKATKKAASGPRTMEGIVTALQVHAAEIKGMQTEVSRLRAARDVARMRGNVEGAARLATEADAKADEMEARIDQARAACSIPAGQRGKLDVKGAPEMIAAKAKAGAELAAQYTHADLLPKIKFSVTEDARAFYNDGTAHLNLLNSDSIVLHEITHATEAQNPGILKKCLAFLKKRAGGGPLKLLSELTGDAQYGANELAWEDEWVKRGGSIYAGKTYWGQYTEILTVGVERLHRNPLEFLENDRDYFEFVIQTLQQL